MPPKPLPRTRSLSVKASHQSTEADALSQARQKYKDRIKRLNVLADGSKSDFWNAQKEELELSAKANEKKRDEILEGVPDDAAVAYAQARAFHLAARAFRGTIANVEQARMKADALNSEVGVMGARLKEIAGEKDSPEGAGRV